MMGRLNHQGRLFYSFCLEEAVRDDHLVRKIAVLEFAERRNERFRDSDIFRRVFEQVVETCIAAGFVGGEGFAVDASLIVADANKQRSIPGTEWNKERAAKDASRAVKEYLATLDDAALGAASRRLILPRNGRERCAG